ncbi:MAG: DUF4435 domain-containing protein [Pseudomonas sp.]|uniref:DUF4435 domain-containing protein n=1 Tax=Pseudomonas TaxID=286 RepID=UPI0003C0A54D|nr:DUF4435 domain-containing protein [Pseudomonas sp. VLB120]AGZ37137.1 hypothetical protein PVLB_21790 [Pseudomonas sp. VLB120]
MSDWDKSVGVIVSEIKMMEASAKSHYWLLEGPSDIKFLSPRKPAGIELILSGGKRNVIGAVKALASDRVIKRILGVVDADIDWLFTEEEKHPNIIATDPRDLEGLLLRSSAYAKVLAEFADEKKVRLFEGSRACDVRSYVRDISSFFGKIRAVNDLVGLVSLKKFKPQSFMVAGKWEYNREAAIAAAVKKGVCSTAEELIDRMAQLPAVDCWNYVRGHDAVNILTGGLLSEIGRGAPLDASRIESVLRAGIDDAEYQKTQLYQRLTEWQTSRVLENNG